MNTTKDSIIDDLNNKQILVEVSIDCDPYQMRPNTYFDLIWTEVLGREEPVPEDESGRRFFGAWFWKVRMTEEEKKAILAYCQILFDQDHIRGARLITLDE